MAVSLTISKMISGAAAADTLAGGGTGLDLGNVTNAQYAPIISQSANTGHQDLFVRSNSSVDPVTNVKMYLSDYADTGFTWGGGNVSSASDLATILALGAATGSSKNNNDGLSGGVWIEQDWLASTANQFDLTTRPSRVLVFGKNGTSGVTTGGVTSPDNSGKNGSSQSLAFDVCADANSYWNGSSEVDATAPVNGQLAGTGQLVATQSSLGNRLHFKKRVYIPSNFAEGGIFQYTQAFQFSFTA